MKIGWILGALALLIIFLAVTYLPDKDEGFPTAEVILEDIEAGAQNVANGVEDTLGDITGARNVEIVNFAFSPEEMEVSVGDTVVWTNLDRTRHTITSEDWSMQGLDSPLLSKGQSYSYTFNEPGLYEYHCTPHPYMKGRIAVE